MEGDGEGPTAKRGSSTACPGASRKDKGAGHSAQNDDGQGARLKIKAAATTANRTSGVARQSLEMTFEARAFSMSLFFSIGKLP